jgi:hypothetical protein
MKTEKPAPKGASFSGKSIESRRPKTTAPGSNPQARKRALLASTRTDRIRIIMRLIGKVGGQSFLKCPSPALGDRTVAQLLQDYPMELPRRLKWLDALNDDFYDELISDPDIEHFGGQHRKSQADRVLEILDELERGGHE